MLSHRFGRIIFAGVLQLILGAALAEAQGATAQGPSPVGDDLIVLGKTRNITITMKRNGEAGCNGQTCTFDFFANGQYLISNELSRFVTWRMGWDDGNRTLMVGNHLEMPDLRSYVLIYLRGRVRNCAELPPRPVSELLLRGGWTHFHQVAGVRSKSRNCATALSVVEKFDQKRLDEQIRDRRILDEIKDAERSKP